MRDLFRLIGWTVVDLIRSRAALEAEIWTLRQQINVLRRTAPKNSPSASSTAWYSLVSIGCALAIVKPDTLVRWHRAGFRLYWRSEEHTSELQSLRHLVCRLLLEKKKNKQ